MDIVLWIVLAVIVVVVLWIIGVFNGLVVLKNRAKEAWADIDVQLKRRYDLIPNLVETVKGYATHERELFENVTKARANAISAQGVADKSKAENMLTETLKSIFAVAENYPDLKASQNFLQLQDELSDTENKIQAARRFYNQNVMDLNTRIQSFPSNIVAGMFSFTAREFFEVEEARMREAVKVKF